jgi:hypothetical protein
MATLHEKLKRQPGIHEEVVVPANAEDPKPKKVVVSSVDLTAPMDWDEFWYAFINEMMIDDSRRKTIKGLRHFCKRVPQMYLVELNVTVFAPGAWQHGLVTTMPPVVIYLAPALEKESQAEVDFTVAHEFAHAVLGHSNMELPPEGVGKKYLDLSPEIAADKLVADWGFTVPKRRNAKRFRVAGALAEE